MTGAQKFWKYVGESNFYKNMGKVHTRLYRLSGGRIGHKTGPVKNLLLTSKGRKTGEMRTCPLTYFEDRGRFVLIASNGGNEKHPVWYLNLKADPRATIEVGPRKLEATASTAAGEERARLWSAAVRMNPQYAVYESITSREIPVVVLTPTV
ncbi:MAG TPA: nitroreductase family deazaflavin-dependent oxidoreductase [Candidatus Limnocylindrales bacterium]|nr:nitroreductase family deazaflavin-dependent oxidoreductase [Candidatus Limnocylindrales bacterium]